MSDAITIHNGGEAPHAAKGVAGADVAGMEQGGVMQQNGGAAPEAGGTSQLGETAGTDAGGDPPLGGVVHGP